MPKSRAISVWPNDTGSISLYPCRPWEGAGVSLFKRLAHTDEFWFIDDGENWTKGYDSEQESTTDSLYHIDVKSILGFSAGRFSS